MLRALALLAITAPVAAAADLTIKGCAGNWSFDPTTNVAICGTPTLPPPPPPSVISCAGFSRTVVQKMPYTQGQTPTIPLVKGDALVISFTIPANATGTTGSIALFEYQGPVVPRWVTLSSSPCTWTPPDGNLSQHSMETNTRFAVVPGQTYYLNVRMDNPSAPNPQGGCGQTGCAVRAELATP